jgi:hypothetical protein
MMSASTVDTFTTYRFIVDGKDAGRVTFQDRAGPVAIGGTFKWGGATYRLDGGWRVGLNGEGPTIFVSLVTEAIDNELLIEPVPYNEGLEERHTQKLKGRVE